MNARITLLPAFEHREELIPLYEEYAAMLVRVEPIFTRSLEQQNYAEEIIRRFSDSFSFVGMMSCDHVDASAFHGLPVFREEEFDGLDIDAVLLTERVKYAEAVYQSLHERCRQRGIPICNMYGLDEARTHDELETCRPQSAHGWKKLCQGFDLVAFEAMDTLLTDYYTPGEYAPRHALVTLIRWLLSRGVDVRFSLRKSCPEQLQLAALEKARLCPELENKLIRRQGEDLSFRRLTEENPGKKILYIGMGLVNECLLPRCYGIQTYRFIPSKNSLSWGQRNWYMSVGEEGERVPFDEGASERIKQSIRDSEVVSFDVFDTLLIRKTLVPWDVFELVEKRQREKGAPIDGFVKYRKAATESLQCATIHEIYVWLREKLGWSEAFAQEILGLELEIERENILPRTEAIELFFFALQEKKKVVLTSDMYLPADILGGLLSGCGVRGYEKLLVSCDFRKDKRSGLFGILRRMYGPEKKLLHIGDDPTADAEMCRREGIDSVLLPSPLALAVSRGWEDSVLSACSLMERCLLGMCVAELFRDPFQNPNLQDRPPEDRLRRFAVSVIGPLAVGFLTWLIRELGSFPCDGVLFFGRDGYFLRLAYQSLGQLVPLPPSVYYYTSRHAAFLCCADREECLPLAIEQGKNAGISVEEILSRIYDLKASQIKQRQPGESEKAFILRHMPAITGIAEANRAAALACFDKAGLKRNGSYAVVDCIAAGTTQWFMEQWMPCRFRGFYMGNCNPGGRKCIHIEDYLAFQNDSLLRNYIELERFFTSPEPSVRCMGPNGEIVFFEEKREAKELEELALVHRKALSFAQMFFSSCYTEGEIIAPEIPEEMFAADGCHWVQTIAYDDWTGSRIPTKKWESGER